MRLWQKRIKTRYQNIWVQYEWAYSNQRPWALTCENAFHVFEKWWCFGSLDPNTWKQSEDGLNRIVKDIVTLFPDVMHYNLSNNLSKGRWSPRRTISCPWEELLPSPKHDPYEEKSNHALRMDFNRFYKTNNCTSYGSYVYT